MSQTTTYEVELDSIRPVAARRDEPLLNLEPVILPPTQDVVVETTELSKTRAAVVIATLAGTMFVSSFSSGLLTVALPRMAKDVDLAPNLLLWPASVYPLTAGCLLIAAGSIADVVGSRMIFIVGCALQGIFVLACGLAETGLQLILFRAMQGIAVAMCLPTAVSIVTTAFQQGRRRNMGFAFMGAGQPFGFCVGLVLGGLFVDTIGWRSGYYMCAATNIAFALASYWSVPKDKVSSQDVFRRLRTELDWVGAAIISLALGLLSYVLAMVSGSPSNLKAPVNIALFVVSLALVPGFVFWMNWQEKKGKPALIPNSIWKNTAFTSVCIVLLLSWSVLNVMEFYTSLYFQEVQSLTSLQTALRFLPEVFSGAILNILTGFYAHKFHAGYLVSISTLLSGIAPLLMAITNPSWSYWYSAFWAMLILPVSADILFTVGALVVTSAFPPTTQALAGAVFQTVAQFGNSLGLAIMASISLSVTAASDAPAKDNAAALLEGYRVAFWVSFGWVLLAVVVGGLGLRKAGKIGVKRE